MGDDICHYAKTAFDQNICGEIGPWHTTDKLQATCPQCLSIVDKEHSMIKIECESSDVLDVLRLVEDISRREGCNRAHQDLFADKVRSLESQLSESREDAKRAAMASNVQEIRKLITAVALKQRINAIKSIRILLGYGLKEAVDMMNECMPQ